MELSPEQLVAELDSGPLRPAYLIAGPEPLRVLEAADAVRAAARRDGIAEREVFEAVGNQREPDWAGMSASFGAPSLFATRRLMELRLPTGKPGKEGAKLLLDFCSAPPSDVVLLVTCGEWSRSHGGDWSQAIGRIGRVAVATAVKPHELGTWIDRRLRSRGFSPDRDAVQFLAERVEGNLLAAAQEVEKLALLFRDAPDGARGGRPLTLETLQSLIADAARYDVFRLIDAAMNRQPAQVVRILAGLRAEGEAIPALLGMIVMELSRGAALAQVQAKGGNLAAAFKAQRVWDTKQPMYRRALQQHGPEAWDAMLVQAGRVDRIAKGRAPGDAWVELERLMVALAERGATRLLATG
ncbi:DNA polymerase III subunit delta [Lysobacter xanthus]